MKITSLHQTTSLERVQPESGFGDVGEGGIVQGMQGVEMVGTLGDGQVWVKDPITGNLIPGYVEDLGTAETDTTKRLAPDGAGGTDWVAETTGLTVEDEGVPLATDADVLNFVGAGVTATGTGGTKTITIPSGGGGSGTPGWFNVKDPAYGAVGDGTTDDTAAINLAIAALIAAGRGVLYFPAGTYKITAGLTTLTVPFLVLGDGSNAGAGGAVSLINCTSTTAVVFNTTATYGRFEKLAIVNTSGGTVTAGAAITATRSADAFARTMYQDLYIQGFYDGVDSQSGTYWSMRDVIVYDSWHYGVRIRNLADPDAGDWLLDKVSILNNGLHHTAAGIRIESSGAGRIQNLEVLGAIGYNDYGIDIAAAGNTSVLHVIGASIESYGTDGIRSVGDWPFQTFTNIEFGQYGNGTGHAFNLSGGRSVVIDNIVATANTGTPTMILVASMTGLAIGQLTNIGFGTLISGTVDQDSTGGVGKRVFITGTPSAGDVPIASSGTAAAWGASSGVGPAKGTPATSYGTPAAGSATTYIGTGATIAKPTAPDVDFSADVTNNNVTTGHHGLAPKAPNDATQYLDGTGAYSVPAVAGGSSSAPTVPVWNVTFNGDGSTTVFELPAAPYDAYSVAVSVGTGVNQDWALSGAMLTVLTFGTAPVSGTANINVNIMAAVG